MTKRKGRSQVSSDRLSAVSALLADGLSHREICRTLRMSPKTVASYFPGTGWSPVQAGRFAAVLRKFS